MWDGPPDVEIEGHLQYKEGAMKPVKLNTSKLRNTSHAESLMREMDNTLAQSSEDNETPCWTSFQQVVYNTAKASLGKHEKKHQDWFDPNDQILRDLMAKGTYPTKECCRAEAPDPLSKLTKMHAEYYRNIHDLESLNGRK